MTSFRVDIERQTAERVDLEVGFVGEAENNLRVIDAVNAMKALNLQGGPLITINGPCSIPVAYALAHSVAHLYGAVAVKDPKLGKFVVTISHRPDMSVGSYLPSE